MSQSFSALLLPFPLPLPFHAPMVSFPDLTKADGLAALDKHLASKSYVEG